MAFTECFISKDDHLPVIGWDFILFFLKKGTLWANYSQAVD